MSVMIEEDPDFKKILAFLLKTKGFDAHQYKQNYIKRRIAVRMRAAGVSTYHDYLRVLQTVRQEPSFLIDRLTIHVTEFFRDPEVYRSMTEKILPEFSNIFPKNLRVWCAGCSTGEEPYSVAIMVKEWIANQPDFSFEILATDIDLPSVRAAEKGEYAMEALKKVPKSQVQRWFSSEDSKVRALPELKDHIRFRVHDLLGNWLSSLTGFHFIFCRNMLIYLRAIEQQRLYEQFAKVLKPGGYLVLGLTETLLGPSRKFFHCVDVRHRIYQVSEPVENPMELPNDTRGNDG